MRRWIPALAALGIDFHVWDTVVSDHEPDLHRLSLYEQVIWFTGASYGASTGPGDAGETAIIDYLDGGGSLTLFAQDYLQHNRNSGRPSRPCYGFWCISQGLADVEAILPTNTTVSR